MKLIGAYELGISYPKPFASPKKVRKVNKIFGGVKWWRMVNQF